MRLLLLGIAGLLLLPLSAAPQSLKLNDSRGTQTLSRAELLADPATREITIARDPVYGRPMTYRALPARELLNRLKAGPEDYVQARAIDDFSIAIPVRLLEDRAASAFLAIEDPATPWPAVPGKKAGAGPFYLIWQTNQPGLISSEYWAYMLATFAVVDSPLKRWPGLGVDASIPAVDPIRRGLDRYVAVCIACHQYNGEGEGEQGPDLARPMNVIDYFPVAALKKLLRDPQTVRNWPERRMPPFSPDALSDSDIDAVVAWLAYKASRR
jgi:mono/diheme cytochrome c family protein